MPVTPTYPGVYIEELPTSARTITPAPTSITVFIGYTHPFKTRAFGKAVRIFSFSDYEREFGGHYHSGEIPSDVPVAVEQFFLNGGSDAYVVGIEPRAAAGPLTPPDGTLGGIKFTSREPTDVVSMKVSVGNVRQTTSADDTADITIAYGTTVETYRGVLPTAQTIESRIGTALNPLSSLVTIAPTAAAYPAAFTQGEVTIGGSAGFVHSHADFHQVFDEGESLDLVEIFNILAIPNIADNGIWSRALAFCERKRAFMILDTPSGSSASASGPNPVETIFKSGLVPPSANAAFFFPYLRGRDEVLSVSTEVPPSGFVAGIFARTDQNRGVWKAPAGLEATLKGTTGVVDGGRMTDMQQGVLNNVGINCIRTSSIGSVVFGARTVVADNDAYQQWRYVPVRRTALFIEQTLERELRWAIFEPNDTPLWIALRTSVENFMLSLFSQGAFQGKKPSDAFLVTCDSTTTTQTDIDRGIVNIVVGFCPLKPAEFVIVKIAQLAGQVQS